MSRLDQIRVAVVGAGAVGSMLACVLQRAGARVTLLEPAALGDNASGVAAGMLAPAFETALDPAAAGHLELLLAARDAWRAVADDLAGFGGAVVRSGALWVADEASQADMLGRLKGLGLEAESLGQAAAEQASPGLVAPQGAVHTAEDWRLEPLPMLTALHAAFRADGGEIRQSAVRGAQDGAARLADGTHIAADLVILATGMSPEGFAQAPPELEVLTPIKGQIARFAGAGPRHGPILRAPGVYVAPSSRGAVVGATMQPGVGDRRVDPATIEGLRKLAWPMLPDLALAAATGEAGVRASTPDGLPMTGPSSTPGVWLALGARRNGWLLAPLIASSLLSQLAGGAPEPWTAAFDPGRFGR